jgi:hypothetical protein
MVIANNTKDRFLLIATYFKTLSVALAGKAVLRGD